MHYMYKTQLHKTGVINLVQNYKVKLILLPRKN